MEILEIYNEKRRKTALKRTSVLTAMTVAMLASFWAIDFACGCPKMIAISIFAGTTAFVALEGIYWRRTLRFNRTIKIALLGYSIGLVALVDLIAKNYLTGHSISYHDFDVTIGILLLQFLPTFFCFYTYQF